MDGWSSVGHALLAALLREPPLLTIVIAPLLVLVPVLALEGLLLHVRPQSVLRRLRLVPAPDVKPEPEPKSEPRLVDLRIEPGFAAPSKIDTPRRSAPVVAFRSRPEVRRDLRDQN